MINHRHWVTLVLLDTLSTKHNHCWMQTLWTCLCVCGIGANMVQNYWYQ